MRKMITFGMVLAMVLVGLVALTNPIASDDCGKITICKNAEPICRYGKPFDGNDEVPLGEDVYWDLTIRVTNNLGYDLDVITVKDRLGAELELIDDDPDDGDVPPDIDAREITHGKWDFYTKGNSDKVFIEWDIDFLADGDTAILTLVISTDINPAGKQEYTTPGCYWLNSGATLKYLDNKGKQQSESSNRIMVTVIGEEED